MIWYWSSINQGLNFLLLLSKLTESNKCHDEDLSARAQEHRQQHAFPGRPEDVSVNKLPAKFLLGILLEKMEWKSEALTIAGANGTPFRRGFGSTAQLQLTEIKGKTPAAAQTNDTLCHSCSVLNEYDV